MPAGFGQDGGELGVGRADGDGVQGGVDGRRHCGRCGGVAGRRGEHRSGLQRSFQLFFSAGRLRQGDGRKRGPLEQLQVVEQAKDGRGVSDAHVGDAAYVSPAAGLAPGSQTPDQPGQRAVAEQVRDVSRVELPGPQGCDDDKVGKPSRAAQPRNRLIDALDLPVTPRSRRQRTVDAIQFRVVALADKENGDVERRHGAGPRSFASRWDRAGL